MKLRFTTRRIVCLLGGLALLFAVSWSVAVRNDKSSKPSVKQQTSSLPPRRSPPIDDGATKKSTGRSTSTDPLIAGIYSDDLATVKARFLTDVYNEDYGLYLSAFAARLAKEEPEAGFSWLLTLESTNHLQVAASAFGRELQNCAPAKLDWALKQSMPSSIFQALASGAAAAMSSDLDASMRFIRKASKSPIEADWLARSLMMTLSQDRGADGCLKLMRLADEFPNSVPSEPYGEALFYLWTADPAKALAIMEAKHEFQSNPAVFASFTDLYARKDLAAASKWVSNLPDGLAKDYAISSIAKAASHVSPLSGLRWAVSIRGSDLRPQAMNNLVELSAYHDPQATRKVIEQAGFSAEESEKWIAKIEQQEARLR
jgi:hypothetical protein